MKINRGESLPLGVSVDADKINFSVEVKRNSICQLLLFKLGDIAPSYIYDLEPNPSMGNIRSAQIEDIEQDIVGYHYLIDGEVHIDSYSKELIGRAEWNSASSSVVYTKLLPIKSNGLINKSFEQNDSDHECRYLNIPNKDVISYRLHIRGFSKHSSSKVKAKGTFQGIVEKIPYFLDLGINQLQLLPCHEFIEEGLYVNYWGYASGCHMAMKSAYTYSTDVIGEFRYMVEKLHKNNIEVILDMPFVDAPSYTYQVECLRYLIMNYRVDGFLLNPYVTNLEQIKYDSLINSRKIIVRDEAFQNATRSFFKGDEGRVKEMMHLLRKSSVDAGILRYNYIASHDGFTMNDLVSYDRKHNELNGEKNADGQEYNYCWNCGVEGPTRKKAIQELRRKQMRNAWVLLMMAQGTPCMLAGDEFGNTQLGNNNAYCQDNDISWLDWRLLQKNSDLYEFVKGIIQIRRQYGRPYIDEVLKYQGENQKTGIPSVSYHGEDAWITPDEVASRQLGILYASDSLHDEECYIAYNMHWEPHTFALPMVAKNKSWHRVLDTATGSCEKCKITDVRKIEVEERSIMILVSE